MSNTSSVLSCSSGTRLQRERVSLLCLSSDGEQHEKWKRAILWLETGDFSFDSKYTCVSEKHTDTTTLSVPINSLSESMQCHCRAPSLMPSRVALQPVSKPVHTCDWSNKRDAIFVALVASLKSLQSQWQKDSHTPSRWRGKIRLTKQWSNKICLFASLLPYTTLEELLKTDFDLLAT